METNGSDSDHVVRRRDVSDVHQTIEQSIFCLSWTLRQRWIVAALFPPRSQQMPTLNVSTTSSALLPTRLALISGLPCDEPGVTWHDTPTEGLRTTVSLPRLVRGQLRSPSVADGFEARFCSRSAVIGWVHELLLHPITLFFHRALTNVMSKEELVMLQVRPTTRAHQPLGVHQEDLLPAFLHRLARLFLWTGEPVDRRNRLQ